MQIAFGRDEGAARLRHLGAIDGKETVGADAGWYAETAFVQHGWPEECMEIKDVFTDEVNQFGFGIRFPVGVEIQAFFFGECLEGTHVTDGRIEPHVKIFTRCIGDRKAEVRRVA